MRLPGPTHRVITCTSEAEAAKAIADAQRILAQLGVQLHPQKTRIVHINRGFEFLGYQIKRGRPRAALRRKLGRSAPAGTVYAYPSEKSINRFKDEVRQLTKRRMPLLTEQIIAEMNPILRGWGQYYKRSHVRRLFTQLDALDRAATMVAPMQALALRRLETTAADDVVWRTGAGQPFTATSSGTFSLSDSS